MQLSSDGKNRACWHSQRIPSCQGIKCDWMNEKSSKVTSCYFCWLNGLSLLFFSRIVLPISVEEVCTFYRCFFMVYIYKKFRFESGHNLKSLEAHGCIFGRILPVLRFSSLRPVSSVGQDSLDIEMMNRNK